MSDADRVPAHSCLPEPQLAFHPERADDRSTHPLRGLLKFGPYSRSLINNVIDPIRVATIAPQGETRRIVALLDEWEQRHVPVERRHYLPEFPGFSAVFGLRAVVAPQACRIELSAALDQQVSSGSAVKPHIILAEAISGAIKALANHRGEFDVVMILLPRRWEPGFEFEGEDGEDFDLHDFLKAGAAALGIATQILNEDSALAYPCRCSVMWRLGIALYCKAGGVPWKLADVEPDSAYVGISYALKANPGSGGRFVVCCSQVFDADGAGLQFLAYEPSDDVRFERKNPFLSRGDMRGLMARSLLLYQQRHAGRSPRQLVVHKSTEFTDEEVHGCFDALKSVPTLDLIQVLEQTPWRGIRIDRPKQRGQKGEAAAYPCQRGTFLPMGGRELLVWTQGNVPDSVSGKDYYKEGKGIPGPLGLQRFAGHGAWPETVQRILGLTKMNWNHDGLYDRLPVTLHYSKVLATVIKHMPRLASRPYEFRFFM